MNKTSIEWTHRPETGGEAGGFTWNPIRAKAAVPNGHRAGTFCTRISPGCLHCYASTINKRFGNGLEFTVPNLEKVEFFIDEKILAEPLRRKKPATIFVGDMFDLFHEAIPQELIAMVFGVIASAGWHTFQVLTKRATRMQALIADVSEESFGCSVNEEWYVNRLNGVDGLWNWPLPNLWLGVSVESQQYADERIPLLLQTPAAVRFLSVEPMLEAVDVTCLSTANAKYLDSLRGNLRSRALATKIAARECADFVGNLWRRIRPRRSPLQSGMGRIPAGAVQGGRSGVLYEAGGK